MAGRRERGGWLRTLQGAPAADSREAGNQQSGELKASWLFHLGHVVLQAIPVHRELCAEFGSRLDRSILVNSFADLNNTRHRQGSMRNTFVHIDTLGI